MQSSEAVESLGGSPRRVGLDNKGSILFLTNTYPDFDASTRGIFIRKMGLLLQNEGYRVSVVTPKIFAGSRYFEDGDEINVYRFPFWARGKLLVEYKRIPYFRMILYYLSGTLFTLYALLRNRSQLIHVHWAIPTGLIGVFVGALFRKPVLVTVHGSDFRMAAEGSPPLRRIFLFVCKRASFLSCVSETLKKGMEQMGIQTGKISTFPMGVDERFLEVGKKRLKKLPGHPYTVLSNRNLHPLYNISLLIRAIPLVLKDEPHTRFLIAGSGPEKANLEAEAKRFVLNSSVCFLGHIPHEKMPDLLAEADIYISTSSTDGTSVSLLEAMAAGVFPIVTAIPSNLEWVVDGKNGFLVSVESEDTLAKRILEAIRSEKLVEESRPRNLDAVSQVLWPATVEKVEGIYSGLLRPKARSGPVTATN